MPPSSIVLAARARRALARPGLRRTGVAALATVTALTVLAGLPRAADGPGRWGATRTVAVATRDLAPGDTLDAGAVRLRSLPEDVVGDGALSRAPTGAVVRARIVAGEPLVAARLAPAGLTGTAALVPAGERAVAVPVGPAGVPPLVVGDRVDVVAVLPAGADAAAGADGVGRARGGGEAGRAPAFTLVPSATVVDVADDAVSVAVPEPDAARVAWTLGQGTVVLTLAGG